MRPARSWYPVACHNPKSYIHRHEGTGSVPGFRSAVVHLPDDGFGVAILANDDTLGGLAAWVALKFRIVDELLGLNTIDWKSR